MLFKEVKVVLSLVGGASCVVESASAVTVCVLVWLVAIPVGISYIQTRREARSANLPGGVSRLLPEDAARARDYSVRPGATKPVS